MTTQSFILTGTEEVEPQPLLLKAGALTAELVNGNLRTIRHGGTEVLRAIGYIVRDKDWGTYEPQLVGLSIDQTETGFEARYSATCESPSGSRVEFGATISGKADGLLEFEVEAVARGDFETARCGFCVLHPVVGLAGEPIRVEHVDGTIVDTKLPDLIDPWQPFKDMRAITHAVRAGMTAECRMEGDTFEMEDQRNWSDASYKTYVRPLALPWPYVLKSGEVFRQKVSLKLAGAGAGEQSRAGTNDDRIRVELGADGPKLPEIGVVVYPDDAAATLANTDLLKELRPGRLLFHFDPTAGHGSDALRAFAAVGESYPVPSTLECVVPCRRDLAIELSEVAAQVREAGLKLTELAVSPSVDRKSTPPGSKWPDCPPLEDVYAAARAAFPDLRLGGGMFSYFTELNRKRVPADQLEFITHCTCPVVHAADDLSVMQSLEALPFITRSVRAIYGDMPYRIGPSTIAMRQNPYGSTPKENPQGGRIAMADRDPRHNGLFAAAWSLGYAAAVAPAGLDQLTLSAFAGPFGVVAGEGEPAPAGGPRPLFHVLRSLAMMAGSRSIQARSSAEDRLAVLAARGSEGEIVLLIANLTPDTLTISLGLPASAPARERSILDARSVEEGQGFRPLAEGGDLVLGAYAIARVGF